MTQTDAIPARIALALAGLISLATLATGRAQDTITGSADLLPLNEEQIAALGLRLSPLEAISELKGYAWPARVDIPLAHRDMLSAPVNGRIQDVLVVHGEVKAGQPVIVLDSAQLVDYQKEYQNTLAQLQEAEKTFARTKRLRQSGSASEKQYLAARTRLETLRNQKNAQAERLLFSGLPPSQLEKLAKGDQPVRSLTLTAPKDGLLFDLQVERNQRVDANQTLAHIGEIREVVVDVDLPLDEVGTIRTGQKAQIVNTPWTGSVAFIGQQADPRTQKVTVHVRFDNPQRSLLPGALVRVQFIRADEQTRRLFRVPSRALVSGETGQEMVFVRRSAGFIPQPVEVVYRDERDAIIAAGPGVQAGDELVSFGAIFLKGMMEGEGGEDE